MLLIGRKRFTDREEPRRLFFDKLTTPQADDEYRLLTFYGVGGQGKSELFHYFQDLKTDQDDLIFRQWAARQGTLPDYHLAPLSFHLEENRNPAEALVKLRGTLAEAKLNFFHFDLAFSYYLKAASPNIDMRDKYPELFRGENDLLHDAVDMVGSLVPGVGAINIAGKYVLKLRPNHLMWYQATGKALENELKQLGQQELLEKLPVYLGRDLRAALDKPDTPRLAILLDTYEALWESKVQQTGLGAQQVDGWVRDLVSACPGVLFVFFGRDYLKWDAFSKPRKRRNYTEMLDGNQHLLGGLSDPDADLFLKTAGIWQPQIRKVILASSKDGTEATPACLPFYLDLQLETYHEIKRDRDTPTLEDFGGHKREVVARFLRHLNDHQENALHILAQARQFDAALFEQLKGEFLSGSPVVFHRLVQHSFIREDQQRGQYVMHQLMREHLVDYLKCEEPERYGAAHQFLFNLYDHRAKVEDVKAVLPAQEAALVEAAYHKGEIDKEGFSEWLFSQAVNYSQAAKYRLLVSLYRHAIEIIESTAGEHHPDYATGLNNLALALKGAGQYEEALPLLLRATELTKQAVGEQHVTYATRLSNLGRLLEHVGRYEKAEPLLRQAASVDRTVLGEQHPDYATSLNILALVLKRMHRYEKAEPLFRQAIQIYKRELGEQHPSYSVVLNNLGNLLRDMGRYTDAEPLLREALEITGRAFGEQHPSYATRLNNLALLAYWMERYGEAETLYRRAVEIDKHTIGEQHPDYAIRLSSLAAVLEKFDHYEEARALYRQAIKICRTTLGDDHPSTKNVIANYRNMLDTTT